MQDPDSAKTGRIGLARVQLAVVEELGWLFRNQPTDDYGIDALIEIVDGHRVVPKLLALQIKGGESWFREPTPSGWWYRPNASHVQYWTDHSLPVVIVLYDEQTKIAYWQLVNRKTLARSSRGGWKLLVPRSNVLNAGARDQLREAAAGDPYVLRIRELQLARPWMEMLQGGRRLVIDIEEWINKTSGRGSITLGVDNEDGSDPTEIASWGVMLGLASYAEVVPKLFAWADVDVHAETYDDAEYDAYKAECVIYDEGDRFVTEDFDEWRQGLRARGLRPYANGAGEVDFWRLELTLNELGRSFLIVDQFATSGHPQFTPGPTDSM
ncbi:DUF4365 domain-containing protein [Microbispora bryophytorum]|uniref:DUF4365 domain-containing protein n=1 Tax=Microbispora bryophytorum TaxID=1460882 RepID=UPI0033DAE9AC